MNFLDLKRNNNLNFITYSEESEYSSFLVFNNNNNKKMFLLNYFYNIDFQSNNFMIFAVKPLIITKPWDINHILILIFHQIILRSDF